MKNLLVLSLLILLFSCANKQDNKEGFQYQRTQKETTTPTQTKIKKTPVDLSNKGVRSYLTGLIRSHPKFILS